jgi:amino-acid N-acetyltransferase
VAPQPDVQPVPHPVVHEILNPIIRRTAVVKFQGPFTDRQLDSVARGVEYLTKLGLVSVVVIERDDWWPGNLTNEKKL